MGEETVGVAHHDDRSVAAGAKGADLRQRQPQSHAVGERALRCALYRRSVRGRIRKRRADFDDVRAGGERFERVAGVVARRRKSRGHKRRQQSALAALRERAGERARFD